MRLCKALLLAVSGIAALAWPQSGQGGKELFDKRCGGCHALDIDKEGPRLRGVYGRAAGSVKSFEYSEALKNARVTWNEDTLDKWLTDTGKVAPNNDMTFRVEKAEERSAIIGYLKEMSGRRE